MTKFKLAATLSLLLQPDGKKLRLVLSDGSTELACRKEAPGRIKRFLASAEASLFKGRLQLRKNDGVVVVVLKGEAMGVVTVKELLEGLPSSQIYPNQPLSGKHLQV